MLALLFLLTAVGCQQPAIPEATPTAVPPPTPPLGAGFRYSSYGPWYDPGAAYWAGVGQEMAGQFPTAVPETVWIVGTVGGQGTTLNFPGTTDEPYIYFTPEDKNEAVLTLFDEMGGRVWLQVEPGHADVETLIHILLEKYGHHPSVVGVGVDVEWYGATADPEGIPVTDEVAQQWVDAAHSHGEQYRIFLKHWLPEFMPPTVRDGILFVDDSQGFGSLEEMAAEFTTWGETFAPSPVAFQFGYQTDKVWWDDLENPPQAIGNELITAVPNLAGLFWVDFTILEMFPPER